MKSNFEFLNRYWPALAQIGAAAESYVYSDANACLYKLGMFGERLILEIFAFEHIKEPTIDNTHANRIRLPRRKLTIFCMRFARHETMRSMRVQILWRTQKLCSL